MLFVNLNQDVASFMGHIAQVNEKNTQMAFKFAQDNVVALYEKLGSWRDVSEVFMHIVQNFGTLDRAKAVEDYFSEMSDHLIMFPYLQLGLQSILTNVEWLKYNKQSACEWVERNLNT